MEKENKGNSKLKLIAAAFMLLLGIILAIGYPTGGIKAPKHKERAVLHVRQKSETQSSSPAKTTVKKSVQKKKRIQPVAPPLESDESQDEGC